MHKNTANLFYALMIVFYRCARLFFLWRQRNEPKKAAGKKASFFPLVLLWDDSATALPG